MAESGDTRGCLLLKWAIVFPLYAIYRSGRGIYTEVRILMERGFEPNPFAATEELVVNLVMFAVGVAILLWLYFTIKKASQA